VLIESGSEAKKANPRARLIAVVEACFVAFLWSTSWVIIKYGLVEIPPLLFAGLRYSIASVLLLAVIGARSNTRVSLRGRPRRWWLAMLVYGAIYIAATQGTQFVALKYLPAITLALLLNLTPIFVLVMAIAWLREVPSPLEILFIIIGIAGVLIYFYPLDLVGLSVIGLLIGIISLAANSVSAIIGRAVNRTQDTPAIVVTGISMTIGSVMLLAFGVASETINVISPTSWLSILWLAVVNTAIAFTLWNRAMRELRAIDTTLINSTMMPQIVLLSIMFLGEYPDFTDWIGLILLMIGITAVQILQARRKGEGQ